MQGGRGRATRDPVPAANVVETTRQEYMAFKTQFEFTLPKGFVDKDGNVTGLNA